MFSISAKGIYGLQAMSLLEFNDTAKQIREIADEKSIPQYYLEQIMVTLRKGGVVKSFRGAHGGYALAEDPSKISVLQILEILEGSIELFPSDLDASGFNFLWNPLHKVITKELSMSLKEFRELAGQNNNPFVYNI